AACLPVGLLSAAIAGGVIQSTAATPSAAANTDIMRGKLLIRPPHGFRATPSNVAAPGWFRQILAIQRSEANADHGAVATATAADDAWPGKSLLARTRRLGLARLLLRPRLVLVAVRLLLAASARIVFVVVLARGGRRRRLRLLVGDANFTLQCFAGLAFKRADARGALGELSNQILCHDRVN